MDKKRKVHLWLWTGLLMSVMVLGACQFGPPLEVDPLIDPLPGPLPTSEVTPTEHMLETLVPTPAASPTPELGDTGGSRCEVEGQETFMRQEGNFCFSYPSDFEILGSGNPLQAYLMGPALDQSPEPVRASLLLQVRSVGANTYTLEEAAAQILSQFPGMEGSIQQTPITFGGQPAIQLEPVPGREGSRDVVLLYNDLLYHFAFSPDVNNFPQAQADFDRLFNSVDSTFSILQP